jgi:hypothetical protein
MSSDLVTQITDRLPSGTGIYLRSGDKTTAGVLYYRVGPAFPFFEIHTDTTHVFSLQDFWKKHVSSHQIEDDSPTDQQLLERLSINFQAIEAAQYPPGTSKTVASILATEEHTWARYLRRIDAFKMGAFDRIYEKLDFGTTLCYMELGSPPLYLTLERRYSQHTYPGNIVLTASEDQPANIDLSARPTRQFNHLNHVSNWYGKHVARRWQWRGSPLYDLYLVSGPYKGRNLGNLLDDSAWTKAATEAPELFPIGSQKDRSQHIAAIDYMLKKNLTICKPCQIVNVIAIMKYVRKHGSFVNVNASFKTTVVAKAREFIDKYLEEAEMVAECRRVIEVYDPLPNVVEVAVVEVASNSSSSSSSSSVPVATVPSNSSSSIVNEVVSPQPIKVDDLPPPMTADEIIITLRRLNAELEQKNATLKAMLEASLKTL